MSTATLVEPPAPRHLLGIQIRQLLADAQTRNTFSLFDILVPPGAFVPLHTHAPAEAFHVLEGAVEFATKPTPESPPTRFAAAAHATVHIPPGAIHSFKNPGPAPARLLVICEASLQNFFADATTPDPAPPGPPGSAEIERVLHVMTAHHQALLGPHPD